MLATFDAVSAPYGVSEELGRMPWATCGRGSSIFPFIVTVDYGWQREPLVGHGASKKYLCLFGCYTALEEVALG